MIIEQDPLGNDADTIVVDLSTLREREISQAVTYCRHVAEEYGSKELPAGLRPLDMVPFNIIPADNVFESLSQWGELMGGQAAEASAESPTSDGEPRSEVPVPENPSDVATEAPLLRAAVDRQADLVRALKAQGRTNADEEVRQQVQVLLDLKAQLEVAEKTGAGKGEEADKEAVVSTSPPLVVKEEDPLTRCAIWQIPALPLYFTAPRAQAKEYAKALVTSWPPVASP